MTDDSNDTIAAIATPPGPGGVGVVRVSGPAAPSIARALLGQDPRPRHAYLVALRDSAGELIDRGLLLAFPAPHSYTGEHVLELQCHGSMVVLDTVLRRVCGIGARLARPGEFTERAFLNGKLDLAQAEAVADLIEARSIAGARAAMRSLEGAFSRRVDALLRALVTLRVHVEAAIDFPEEEIDFLADPAITAQLSSLRADLSELQADARRGVRLTDGLSVAIVGRPNVGKSSLLNALAGSDRAIVTEIAGTTRDVLRELVTLDGVTLELIDTAGLRESEDPVEREGVRRARAQLEHADVALLVSEAGEVTADLLALDALPRTPQQLVLVNKVDRVVPTAADRDRCPALLPVSARDGGGLDELRARLRSLAGVGEGTEGAFSARRRHLLALDEVSDHLDAASHALSHLRAGEIAAEELRLAQQALARITGAFGADDLLGAIFSSFCIGK